ncbi:MAG: hypothetical protein ACI819_002367, partial [Neolewinella sp.]
ASRVGMLSIVVGLFSISSKSLLFTITVSTLFSSRGCEIGLLS